METDEEYEEHLDMDACCFPAYYRRARQNGWPADEEGIRRQYFDFKTNTWKLRDERQAHRSNNNPA